MEGRLAERRLAARVSEMDNRERRDHRPTDPEQLTRPGRVENRSHPQLHGRVWTDQLRLRYRHVYGAAPRLPHKEADVFRTGWLLESTATELAVMLVLRTGRPFFRSHPGRALLWSSTAVAAVTVLLPYCALARPLGLAPLPATILATLAGLTALYVAVNEIAKRFILL
jgi:hypothetical protein